MQYLVKRKNGMDYFSTIILEEKAEDAKILKDKEYLLLYVYSLLPVVFHMLLQPCPTQQTHYTTNHIYFSNALYNFFLYHHPLYYIMDGFENNKPADIIIPPGQAETHLGNTKPSKKQEPSVRPVPASPIYYPGNILYGF